MTNSIDIVPGTREDILDRAARVPAKSGFPTVDQLNEQLEALRHKHPERITMRRVGTSRLGEPLNLYTVGSGALSALIIGGVHPNEPIGSWTVLHLAEQIATDEALRTAMDATFHIMPCADPDGMRLNEGWFQVPENRGEYARSFYRPAPDEQVEWTFPFSYKRAYFDAMLPETQAVARVIDETRPDLYVPLHNAESGGVYYYLSRAEPGLHDMLHALPAHLGVPLNQGEPESAHFKLLAPAIFEMGYLETLYDWLEGLGLDPFPPGSAGNASTAYAEKYGTLSLIAELPYWTHAAADDTTETDQSYAEVLRFYGQGLVDSGEQLLSLLEQAEPLLTLNTPLIRASRAFVPGVKRVGEGNVRRAQEKESQRPATVAERHGNSELLQMFRLRFGGTLLRALNAETCAGTAGPELHRLAARMEDLFASWVAESAAQNASTMIPVEVAVGLQYGAVLAACAQLNGRPGLCG